MSDTTADFPEDAALAGVTTRWWWIRHAPVVDAHEKRLSGQRDVAADTSDTQAAGRLARELPVGALWVVSALRRTRDTAEALWAAGAEQDQRAAGAERIEPLVEPDFNEQAFGDWSGLTWQEIARRADSRDFWDAPATAVPPRADSAMNAESFADQCARVGARMVELTIAHGGRDIVCVAHGGTIRAALVHALDLEPAQALAVEVPNWGLTRLDHVASGLKTKRGGHWRVVAVNQVW